MITMQPKRLYFVLAAAAALAIASGSMTAAQKAANAAPVFQDAIGSWFGRAVPVPGQTICPPGPGCPVPPEVVMIFTVGGDGTFIGHDSSMFLGGSHSTAHGQWERSDPRGIRGEFVLLQAEPTGALVGGFKDVFEATVVSRDEMRGSIDMRFYGFAYYGGIATVDSDGFPTPSPLAPASECSATPGCIHLGAFSFLGRRVKVQ